jgi:signal transduction histidine kinase
MNTHSAVDVTLNSAAGSKLFETPRSEQPAETEFVRRKRIAGFAGHGAAGLLVVVAVAVTVVTSTQRLSQWHLLGLVAAGIAFVGWSFVGTRETMRLLLGQQRENGVLAVRPSRAIAYFGVQFALASLMFWLAAPARATGILWLVLLPPIGQSVVLLSRLGIIAVSLSSIAILTTNVVNLHGWDYAPLALLEFSLAVLFTLVFTQIAVSAEKARVQVERLAEQLTEANRKLGEYAVQAEELAATRERNRLAREIHDSVGHYLTVVHVQLEAARTMLDRDATQALDALRKAQSLTQEGLREIRCSVAALRESPLESRPLNEALAKIVAESQAAGLAVEMYVMGTRRSLTPIAELTLYRAGQEGLTNTRKHARASHVQLVLDYREQDLVRLVVHDDGAGAEQTTGGFGLLGLRERAHLQRGEVRVQTAPGQGFTLEVEVPG